VLARARVRVRRTQGRVWERRSTYHRSYGLGACYTDGRGVDQSLAEARWLYELAVVRGESKHAPGSLQGLNDPLLGQRVVLGGLTIAARNGTRGTAIDFSFCERNPETRNWFTDSGRYTVRLDGPEGRLVRVRAASVAKAD